MRTQNPWLIELSAEELARMLIRPYRSEDAEGWLAIINQYQTNATTLEAFRAWERDRDPAQVDVGLVGEENAAIVAVGSVRYNPVTRKGYLISSVQVDRGAWGRGLGSAVWNALESGPVQDLHPTGLEAVVRDRDLPSRVWAEHRGFSLRAHRYQAMLDLQGLTESALQPHVDRLLGAGIRLQTMVGKAESDWDRLFAQFTRLLMAAPDLEGGEPPSRSTFDRMFRHNPRAEPEGLIMASEGQQEVGMTLLLRRAPDHIYTWFTGIEPEYQGRGLALGLKAFSIQHALAVGVRSMSTHNLSTNAPMLAVNRRLGYVAQSGLWVLRKHLAQEQ